jgi:hypothetical protein
VPDLLALAITNPTEQMLTPAAVEQLQQTHGNQFVQRLIRRAQSDAWQDDENNLLELADLPAPEVTSDPPQNDVQRQPVIQRAWDDVLINYGTMSAEKDQGHIRTARWKTGGSIREFVANFSLAVMMNNGRNAQKALKSLRKVLVADQKTARRGNLKKPSNVTRQNWNRQAAQQAAATFFTKWITAIDAHMEYIQAEEYWLSDFRAEYLGLQADPDPLPPRDSFLANVASLAHMTPRHQDAMEILWDTSSPEMQQRISDVMGGGRRKKRVSNIQYFLEAINPIHVGYQGAEDIFEAWMDGVLQNNEHWVYEEWMPDQVQDDHQIIHYYDDQERAARRVTPNGKQILKADGSPLNERSNFALTADNVLFAGPGWEENVHHSSFLSGLPVKCAGELFFRNSNLSKINDQSGHYKPGLANMKRAVAFLNERMDTSDVTVSIVGHNGTIPVDEFMKL